MVAPIDYTTQVADPFAQALQGFKVGAGIQQLEQERQLAEQQKLQQQRYNQAIARLQQPGATAADFENVMLISNKDQAENIRKVMEGRDTRQNQAALKQMAPIAFALQTGNVDQGVTLLQQQAEAARNSGDVVEAQYLTQLAEKAKEQPKNIGLLFGAKMTLIPGGKEVLDNVLKLSTERRTEEEFKPKLRKMEGEAQEAEAKGKFALERQAADLGLTKAQTNQALATTRKLGTETAKAALELEALKATGGLDPEKTFAQEEKIRKEWQGRSKVYNELQGTFNTLEASAGSANGPGDIALITGFMKMLDPGSVVRETEFATARDTGGLFTQLQNRLEKAKNGQLLSPKQREEYVALSRQYLNAAQKKADQEKKDLSIVVKNYRLNPENVFGAERAPADVPVQITLPNGQVATFPNQKAADDFKAKAGL